MQGQQLNFYRDGKVINFGTPYYSLTLSVNLIVTLLIVFRLRQLRKEVTGAIGSDSAKIYSSISAMLIESAAPCTITAIAWTIPYARGNSVAVCFGVVSDELAVSHSSTTLILRTNLFFSVVPCSLDDHSSRSKSKRLEQGLGLSNPVSSHAVQSWLPVYP